MNKVLRKAKCDTEITKIYVTSNAKLIERDIHYLVMSNHAFPLSVKRITPWNWLISIEYPKAKYTNLLAIIKTKEVRGKSIQVKRIFKSMRLSKRFKRKIKGKYEICKGFLMMVALGISGLIKKKTTIRITNNRANDWQKRLIEIWQSELDNPKTFKKARVVPKIDIKPDGKLEFCIVQSEDYIITYFNEIIDKYI